MLKVDLKFNGLQMAFLMSKPGEASAAGVHRPKQLLFVKGDVRSALTCSWPRGKEGPEISYKHVGTYSGPASGHDLPRAD